MARVSTPSRLVMPVLAAVAVSLALPAFGATPAAPAISGYAATNPRGAPITSAPPGAPMLIEGANLGTSGTVAFNGVPAPAPASWSSTEILVTVPAAPSYPFVGPVTVTTNGQTAKGPAFTITPPPPPPPAPKPGDLDASFGTGGTVLTDFGGSSAAIAVALQPNGQIVAAGTGWANGKYAFALARYNADGSLDHAFGTGGQVMTDFGGGVAQAVAVQPDGRIVAAGWSYATGQDEIALARYSADGSLDSSFGSGGKVLTTTGEKAEASAVAVQPDGRIVVAGQAEANGKAQLALARYNSDGSLDTSFGPGGQVLTDFGGEAAAYALALQPDGDIVAAGYATTGGGPQFALARYHGDGSLDSAFGTGGKVLTGVGSSGAVAHALAIQPDGEILAAGAAVATDGSGDLDFALARYGTNGSLDPAFGIGGRVLTDFGGAAEANAVALQPNGQMIVAGWSNASDPGDIALARYNANGSLDPAFGGGMLLTDLGGNEDANALALQPDGRIVVAGSSDTNGNPEFALARYRGR